MWFNPIIYFYQHRITLLHEYITDAEVVKTTEKHDYFNNLLAQTFQVENISFVNQFYKHSLIKKRITMMTKNKSKQIKKAKYLLLLPLLASMLLYTSCETSEVVEDEFIPETSVAFNADEIVINVSPGVVRAFSNTNQPLKNYLSRSFQIKLKKELEISKGRHLILVSFSTNKLGEVVDLKVKTPNPKLKIQTIDIIKNIPHSSLVLRDGKLSAVKYTLPITLIINEKKDYNYTVPFAIIEEVPVFPGCGSGTREENIKCLNEKIRNTVARNFNVDLSKNLGLSKGKKKIIIFFKINKEGEIVDIKARAPHPTLKNEALRVARLLPKMKPGRQRGEAVGVKYTVPISFIVE